MDSESCVPPGFRFHPTEEELVGYYLKRKVESLKIDLDVIADIDLYRMEPWDLEDRCRLGYEEQNEWYFFSHKDRKYPTGTRTNRATAAGFWKATGRDKAVVSKEKMIGMRKTLVYYKGRAPNGRKSDWIMHEYRLQTSELGPSQEEGWVICRAFKKPSPSHKQGFEAWSNGYHFRNNTTFIPSSSSSSNPLLHNPNNQLSTITYNLPFISPQPLPSNPSHFDNINHLISEQLPPLDSPTSLATNGDHDHEKSIDHVNQIQYDDWVNLFESKPGQPTSSSFTFPNTPLISSNDELDAHSQISHFLGCFPDDL